MKMRRPIAIITAGTAAIIFALVLASAATVTVVVTPDDLQGWQVETTPGVRPTPSPVPSPSVAFVSGPATPPAGSGSAQLSVGPDGSAGAELRHPGYAGTVLPTPTPVPPDGDKGTTYPPAADELSALRYSTYVQQPGSGSEAPYIILDVDYDNNGTRDDTLFFEPQYQNSNFCPSAPGASVTAGTWQTWDALGGCWYSSNGVASSGPGVNVKPLRTITAAQPGAKIVNTSGGLGGVRVVAGLGAGAWDNFVGNVDAFRIGVGADPEAEPNVTIYDFEAAAPPPPPPPQAADLGVTKAADAEGVVSGRNVIFTIRVRNGGPSAASNARLTDTLPGTMTFVSLDQTGDPWSCTTPAVGSGGTVTCTNANFAAGATTTFTLVVNVPSNTPKFTQFNNTAVIASDTADPNGENNSASVTVTAFSCLGDPAPPQEGEPISPRPTVTSGADDGNGTLRRAIQDACAGATVVFNMSQFTGPITLTSGELTVDKNLTIQGPTDTGLTVSGNNSSRVFNIAAGKTVAISNLTIAGGRANSGGGINNLGDLTLSNVTLTGNGAAGGSGGGGAIAGEGGTLFVVNSTISGNTAETNGGGLLNSGTSAATLVNVTVTNNRSDSDGNATGDGGGIAQFSSSPITLRNTIVAGNFKGTGTTASDFFVFSGSPVSSGSANNLIGVDTGLSGITNGSSGNQVGTAASPVDPLLGPLADNGGPTRTHRPLPGSPAANAGSNALAKDRNDTALAADQRGFPRVVGAAVDIGAVEVNYAISATAGTPQSAVLDTNFAAQLQATLTESGRPVQGVTVTFIAPATGASGTFPSGNTAVTDANGHARVTFKANATRGAYTVTANVTPALASPAVFNLTNLAPGRIQFSAPAYQRDENGGAAVITVTRTGGSDGAASVSFSTSGGTATGGASCSDGVDFVNASGTLAWADGDSSDKTFSVTLCDNSVQEPDETVNLALSGLTGLATFGPQTTATLIVLDNDAPGGRIEFAEATYGVAEGAGMRVINVVRTGNTTGAASVSYATDDGSVPEVAVACSATTGLALERCDYTRAEGMLQFAPGEGSKTFVVLVGDDSYTEGAETTRLVLSNPGGGAMLGQQSSATLRIDDDAAESAGNPIDDARNFVRQHYHDFLNRVPDPAGFTHWTNTIESCGSDAQCREVRRINVSAAFFLSIEFKQTGCLVYHFYTVALDRPNGLPGHTEFQRDTQAIQRGLVVGEEGWEAKLEANKQAYAEEFVSRAEFLARYALSMAPADYVNALYAHAGLTPAAGEREAAVAEFNGAADISNAAARARALRRVAESEALHERDVNRAFVLLQYFGYLRRDPSATPDNNLDGYNYWLAKLEQFGGNFIAAEMVKAFISSAEYRQRFGQQ